LILLEQARDAAEKRSAEEERQMEDDQEKELMKRAKWEGEGVSGDEQAKKEEGSHAQRQAAVLMKEDHAAARVKVMMVSFLLCNGCTRHHTNTCSPVGIYTFFHANLVSLCPVFVVYFLPLVYSHSFP
jgi:hypothetical protein